MQNGVEKELQVHYAVLATPSPITRKIAADILRVIGEALDKSNGVPR